MRQPQQEIKGFGGVFSAHPGFAHIAGKSFILPFTLRVRPRCRAVDIGIGKRYSSDRSTRLDDLETLEAAKLRCNDIRQPDHRAMIGAADPDGCAAQMSARQRKPVISGAQRLDTGETRTDQMPDKLIEKALPAERLNLVFLMLERIDWVERDRNDQWRAALDRLEQAFRARTMLVKRAWQGQAEALGQQFRKVGVEPR
ncbi:hypothetical protein [Sphingobium terrigena]|uniref:hypothetical protein n=1 Tax=Sphingobium terrigena TaxID=2304063 RepID=UPI00160018B6|nr:hypothetical protein [Sphingobium terrigena]